MTALVDLGSEFFFASLYRENYSEPTSTDYGVQKIKLRDVLAVSLRIRECGDRVISANPPKKNSDPGFTSFIAAQRTSPQSKIRGINGHCAAPPHNATPATSICVKYSRKSNSY